ncbi:DinB family protein [Rapidithrix thailandica]|uniref:DinB family protein n=1 Tax=Rapidithrix thailandica TaxID=413964 RepID=A0AAW9S6P1_9BACT
MWFNTLQNKLKELTKDALNWKINPESWSILECIEHLNLYGDFYLPGIEERMTNGRDLAPSDEFNSGLLGNYFANSLLPKEKLNKMKTFKDKDPAGSDLELSTLDRFIRQQLKTLELLEKAKKVNLTRIKTSISITKLLKLRLGDTFRVLIYHNQRHLVQAEKVVKAYQDCTNLHYQSIS